MSSDAMFASLIAFTPASSPRSRRLRSQTSPNFVMPTPMTATSRVILGPPVRARSRRHEDLAAQLRVLGVADVVRVGNHRLDGLLGLAGDLVDALGDRDVEGVRARPRAVGAGEDAVARLGLVEDGGKPEGHGARVGVADVGCEQAVLDLL